jgi:hypothetical protein
MSAGWREPSGSAGRLNAVATAPNGLPGPARRSAAQRAPGYRTPIRAAGRTRQRYGSAGRVTGRWVVNHSTAIRR